MAGESLVPNNADGSFVYTPPTGFTGTRVWLYRVTDGTSESTFGASAIVFTITGPVAPPVNTAPVSGADGYAVTQDVIFSEGAPGVLVNDSDADGDALTVVAPIDPVGGSLPGEALSLDHDGSFHYVPPVGYTGARTWTYTATDGTDAGAPAEIVFTIVAPGNTAPVANADSYAVIKDVPVAHVAPGLLANDTDADGDPLSTDVVSTPPGGWLAGESMSLQGTGGAFSYTPPTGYLGTRVFTYTATDGTATSAPVTLTFTIGDAAPANTAPVANNDAYAVVKNTLFSQAAPGIFANDTDADGDSISVINANPPVGGLLPGENMVGNPDGSFDYTPPTDFVGDRVFTYRIFDGADVSAFATVTFTITAGAPVNNAPVAVADSYVVVKDVLFARSAPGVLVNDSDADGDTITVDGWIYPVGGLLPGESLSGKLDGSFAYTPPTGFVGDRVFSYGIFDGTAPSAEATITFSVQPRGGQPGDPLIPTDTTIPTLAATGSTPAYALGTLAVLVAATGFVLVRSSRREA